MTKPFLALAAEVLEERKRQHKKWGDQSHLKDGTDHHAYHRRASVMQHLNDSKMRDGLALTFQEILEEEVLEVFAEEDPKRLRTELIQVAAVALQWVEAIDKRGE